MAHVILDRVLETTTTTGTGLITLSGNVAGFRPFSLIGNGNTTDYLIIDEERNQWEIGIGTYSSSANTLSRTSVIVSTNSNNAVNFQTGTKYVRITNAAGKTITTDNIGTIAQPLDADLTAISALTGTSGLLKKTAANTWTLDTSSYLTGITSGMVTTALGFTPYNATNPAGYLSSAVTTFNTRSGAVTLTSGDVTGALGFTPYNATNPSGYYSSGSNASFGTLSASSTVSGTGFSTYLASPPAIGTTAAAAGAFTTLSASSTVTLSGGTANGVAYLNASKQVTSGSALTFDGSNFLIGGASAFAKLSVLTSGVGNDVLNLQSSDAEVTTVFRSPTGAYLDVVANTYLRFGINNTEQMRLTSTGLGIGTTNPGAKLQVLGTSGAVIDAAGSGAAGLANLLSLRTGTGNTYGFQIKGNYTTEDYLIQNYYSGYLAFGTSNTERMRIDSSGNLGLGVTPSGWGSGFKAFDIGANGSLASDGGGLFLPNNAYDSTGSGGWKYKKAASTPATLYLQTNTGEHRFYTAPSGTAGTAISFSQSMTLDASGNFLVGQTSWAFANNGTQIAQSGRIFNTSNTDYNIEMAGAQGGRLRFYTSAGGNATTVGAITVSTTTTTYATSSDYRLKDVLGAVTGHGERIDALEPVEYDWKSDGSRARGFIAHKFQEVYPNSVTGEKDAVDENGNPKYQTMQSSTSEVIADLVAEIQSLRKRITTLEAK